MQTAMAPSAESKAPLAAIDSRAGKYLIFQLANEEFGTNVLKVREIVKFQEITAVPQTPAFVQGVINLRGQVIPVMDLRSKFGMPRKEATDRTCIVVVRAKMADTELPVGIVVDGVVEVLTLAPADIENTPDFGRGVEISYLLGMAKIKGRVKILLDMDQALCRQELQSLSALLQ